MAKSGSVIETRRLTKRFGSLTAVDNLDIRVRRGEIYGFLGPNGAGKTTTIKMVMGLTHPSSGEVLVNGKRAGSGSVHLRRDMGYLPERIAFYDNLTAAETLEFLSRLKGEDGSMVGSLLREVGLEGAAHRKVGTFSKGMTQLLGVAQAMIGEPSIYVFDEPMGGLDPRWVRAVRDRIRRLKEKGATVLFSSHLLSEMQNLCDRVAMINRGRLVVEDVVDDLSERLNLRHRLELVIPHMEPGVPAIVEGLEGVDDVHARGDTLLVTCDPGVRVNIITSLKEAGLDIRDFRTVEPTLEEAFMRLIPGDEGGA